MGFFGNYKPGRRTTKNRMRTTLPGRRNISLRKKIRGSGFFKSAMSDGQIKGRLERSKVRRGMKNMGISRSRSRRLARRLDKSF